MKRPLLEDNWRGKLPVVLTLAESSLSASSSPAPIHVLVPRASYLHTSLEVAVHDLHAYAPIIMKKMIHRVEPEPPTSDNAADTVGDPVSSQDDASLKVDKEKASHEIDIKTDGNVSTTKEKAVYPTCWFEDVASETPLRWQCFTGILYDLCQRGEKPVLPWRIRVHFVTYPGTILLPLGDDILRTVRANYKHSLKQALCLEHGNPKVALNLSRDAHDKLWKAITNYDEYSELFWHVQDTLPALRKDGVSPQAFPIRVLMDDQPVLQKLCKENISIQSILSTWLPTAVVRDVTVAGISVPRDLLVGDVWSALSYPDHFLYMVVVHA